jgi:hypothetical protein
VHDVKHRSHRGAEPIHGRRERRKPPQGDDGARRTESDLCLLLHEIGGSWSGGRAIVSPRRGVARSASLWGARPARRRRPALVDYRRMFNMPT